MADLETREQFEKWLKTQTREVRFAIAARAALRTFPLLEGEFRRGREQLRLTRDIVLPIIRALVLLMAAAKYPAKSKELLVVAGSGSVRAPFATIDATVADAVVWALHAFDGVDVEASSAGKLQLHGPASASVLIAAAAARAFTPADARAAKFAAVTARAGVARATDIHAAAARDAQFIIDDGAVEDLATAPLWLDGMPSWAPYLWRQLNNRLLRLDEDWDVWTRWYDARLEGGPSPGGEELDIYRVTLPEELWRDGPKAVNAAIKREEEGISNLQTRIFETAGHAAGTANALAVGQAVYSENSLDIEPQMPRALRFGTQDDGPVDVVEFDGSNLIAVNEDSNDRYGEVVRFAVDIVNFSENGRDAPNNANDDACREIQLLREALGQSIRTIRPGLLIPRGDALRNRLNSQTNRDNLSDMPPLSEAMFVALKNLVSAYNVFVSLDDELAKRDEARLGPGVARNLVPPDEGSAAAQSAIDFGAATERAANALQEEAKVAPSVPDPYDRRSRRYSEGAKNFGRALLARVQSFARWVRDNPGKSIGGAAATTILAAKWALANEAWLLKFFTDNQSMLKAIKTILEFLRTLPLG